LRHEDGIFGAYADRVEANPNVIATSLIFNEWQWIAGVNIVERDTQAISDGKIAWLPVAISLASRLCLRK
jgi:hypothetical protein